jgi:hypothetical protein
MPDEQLRACAKLLSGRGARRVGDPGRAGRKRDGKREAHCRQTRAPTKVMNG